MAIEAVGGYAAYAGQVEKGTETGRAESPEEQKKQEQEDLEQEKVRNPARPRYDAFVREGDRAAEPAGKSGAAQGEKAGRAKPEGPDKGGKSERRCIANTDAVDADIRKLKQKKQQVEQELQSAAGDENMEKQLKGRLAQLEAELKMKDNDTYRKQHTKFTNV